MAQAYNSSCSVGRDREDCDSRPAWGKKFMRFRLNQWLGVMVLACNPALGKLKQENPKVKVSPGYKVRPWVKRTRAGGCSSVIECLLCVPHWVSSPALQKQKGWDRTN
jgi:hypothetical protein